MKENTIMPLGIKSKNVLLCILGSAILSFGLYNIHALSGVTEGGIIGLTLLLRYWLNISPSVSSFVLSSICYVLGWRMLGRLFVVYSIIATGSFSLFYAIFEQFPPVWPQIADMPFLAAILGAVFVGVGAGLCVRAGGAPGGDDALAMSISEKLKCDIRWIYMICDVVVLLLSISYLDLKRIALSLLTVILSGQIVGIVQIIGNPKKKSV